MMTNVINKVSSSVKIYRFTVTWCRTTFLFCIIYWTVCILYLCCWDWQDGWHNRRGEIRGRRQRGTGFVSRSISLFMLAERGLLMVDKACIYAGLPCYSKHALWAALGPFLYYPDGFIGPFTHWICLSDWAFFSSSDKSSLPAVVCSQSCRSASPWSRVIWGYLNCSVVEAEALRVSNLCCHGHWLCNHLLLTVILGIIYF